MATRSAAAPLPSHTPRLSAGFRALRVRNFRLLWAGQIVSQIGTWMQTTAQAWLVLQLTNSPFALGFVSTLQFLPFTLLSLFGGLIQLWHIYLLAVLQGITNALDNPVRQAFAVEVVGHDELVNAVALNSMQFNAARVIGPAIAGVVIARLGTSPALVINAVSFLAAIIGLALMNPAQFFAAPKRPSGRPIQQLCEGIGYALHTPIVLLALLVVAFIGTFGYNFNTVLPLLAGFVLKTDAQGFGALSAAFGVGSLIGAVFSAFNNDISVWLLLAVEAALMVCAILCAVGVIVALAYWNRSVKHGEV